jgi:hypothetical protein
MAKPLICEELRRFIKDKIQTVLRLEILLLWHDQQSRTFNAAQIADELGFETEATQDHLKALKTIGLAVQSTTDESQYKYHPANATLGSTVEQATSCAGPCCRSSTSISACFGLIADLFST